MGFPQAPSPPHQYSEAIQLKLYQAFIFSIPILFAIILILLFYLFYLKRRASGTSAYPPVLPRTINDVNITAPSPGSDMKDVKIKLCAVLFDEYMKRQDTQCCVCLGEYEEKEEVVQVPSCKHIFHMDCIHHWLQNNSTCPLCRAPVVSTNSSKSPHHHHHHHHQPPTPASPPNLMFEEEDDNSSSISNNFNDLQLQQQHSSRRSQGQSSNNSRC
ncbi:probable E3 ubiquitin-protein ligase RHA4A isoform X2 [Andrographis paniculata]|uniref:probable E3 ubiquitin-protein ligase RHA4A isoform X2 n=1 Tax=Andrographis paniculata TaxID=175694 RepID=UPI0021E71AAA|nr:probable E3 ubiquitin-protein ligase RHA4A isoform X2 [Andrographis paniculata]